MTNTIQKSETGVTPDDVLAYLKDNPKFLDQHPEAMEHLTPPKPKTERGISDFQTHMIKRLRDDKSNAEAQTKDIIETSRANMNNQARIHDVVLRLLEARSFGEFVQTITMDIASPLNVDIAVMVIEADGSNIPHIHTSGIRIVPQGTIQNWMGDNTTLLQDNISGIEAVYGGGATLVQSQILLRIDISLDTPPALLAFGSRYPDMFSAGQATDQILFLTRVIERCFRQWLSLPV